MRRDPRQVLLTCGLLVVILGVPGVQAVLEVSGAWRDGARGVGRIPRALDVRPWFAGNADGGWRPRWLPAPGALAAWERELEDGSWLERDLLPWTQAGLVRLGAGNEQVYLGRGGWLFYRDDVDHVTTAFPATSLADVVAAVVDLRDALERREVALLVVPVPVKPSVRPDALSRRFAGPDAAAPRTRFASFARAARAEGVDVLDLLPALARLRDDGDPLYLATDTHWTPRAVVAAACAIAAHIEPGRCETPPVPSGEVSLSRRGDTARMLPLPAACDPYPPEPVATQRRTPPRGGPSTILLLGDSFSNIYSLEAMGFGTGAGLVEQLGAILDEPVEAIVRNDGGAFATRVELARREARGRDPLRGKRLVILQFAERELTSGDWRRVEFD